MRERFYETTVDLLERDERVAVVIAEIGSSQLATAGARESDRYVNVGIREQLMVGVASGL
ncbi:MAG: transketolase, partial [Chloroflexi bacterium]